jgi:hypothetical protein
VSGILLNGTGGDTEGRPELLAGERNGNGELMRVQYRTRTPVGQKLNHIELEMTSSEGEQCAKLQYLLFNILASELERTSVIGRMLIAAALL